MRCSPSPAPSTRHAILEFEADLPEIWVDEDMIRRVLINLLKMPPSLPISKGASTSGHRLKGNGSAYGSEILGLGSPSRSGNHLQ